MNKTKNLFSSQTFLGAVASLVVATQPTITQMVTTKKVTVNNVYDLIILILSASVTIQGRYKAGGVFTSKFLPGMDKEVAERRMQEEDAFYNETLANKLQETVTAVLSQQDAKLSVITKAISLPDNQNIDTIDNSINNLHEESVNRITPSERRSKQIHTNTIEGA